MSQCNSCEMDWHCGNCECCVVGIRLKVPASSAQGDLELLRKLRVSLDKIEALWPLDFINPMDYAITVDRLAREHRAELDAAIQRKERGE